MLLLARAVLWFVLPLVLVFLVPSAWLALLVLVLWAAVGVPAFINKYPRAFARSSTLFALAATTLAMQIAFVFVNIARWSSSMNCWGVVNCRVGAGIISGINAMVVASTLWSAASDYLWLSAVLPVLVLFGNAAAWYSAAGVGTSALVGSVAAALVASRVASPFYAGGAIVVFGLASIIVSLYVRSHPERMCRGVVVSPPVKHLDPSRMLEPLCPEGTRFEMPREGVLSAHARGTLYMVTCAFGLLTLWTAGLHSHRMHTRSFKAVVAAFVLFMWLMASRAYQKHSTAELELPPEFSLD